MAVWVDKTVRIHEAEILRLVVGRAARGERFGDETIYLLTLSQLRVSKTSTALLVSQMAWGVKSRNLACRKQHNRNRVADDDARGSVVDELRVL